MAEPNGNYIEHCHWLLALPLSVTSTHSFSSRSWRVILSGYANCDRRSERELYRTLSLAACASAKCHVHPFAQQSFRARNSFGVGKLWPHDWNLFAWSVDHSGNCQVDVKNVDNAFVGVWLSYCHSVTVSSVRYTKLCVDGQPSEHSLWHTLVTSCGVV